MNSSSLSKSPRSLGFLHHSSIDSDKQFKKVTSDPVGDVTHLLTTDCTRCDRLLQEQRRLEAEVNELRGRVRYLEQQHRRRPPVNDDEEDSLTSLDAIGIRRRIYPDHGLQVRIHDGMYELLGPADKLAFLQQLQIEPLGSLSPLLPMTLDQPEGKKFAFMYPLVGTERALKDPSLSRLVDTTDAIYNLCVIGGFVNVTDDGRIDCVNGLAEGNTLQFGPPHEFSADVELALQKRGSLQPVTAAHLRKKKERPYLFAWLGPGDPLMPTVNGCFAYVCGGSNTGEPPRRIYFPVERRGAEVEDADLWQLASPPIARAECRVCMEKRPLVILKPCSHRALCNECAERLDRCPICRQAVETVDVCFDA